MSPVREWDINGNLMEDNNVMGDINIKYCREET